MKHNLAVILLVSVLGSCLVGCASEAANISGAAQTAVATETKFINAGTSEDEAQVETETAVWTETETLPEDLCVVETEAAI